MFAVSANPIEIGLVASLNHPGTNVTGVTGMAAGREHKRLELLHAAVPTAALLGFLLNPKKIRLQSPHRKSINAMTYAISASRISPWVTVGVTIRSPAGKRLLRAAIEQRLNTISASAGP